MENYTRESIRSFREAARVKQKQRGSVIITFIIIAIFLFSFVFYIKTSRPELYSKAVAVIKELRQTTLETVSDGIYEKATTENESGESGEILKPAENLSFDYLSPDLKTVLLSNSVISHTLPVSNAVITSDFGGRTDPVTNKKNATHGGIDLAAPKGSEIYSYSDGTVTSVDTTAVYGNCVTVDHGDGRESFYGHMSDVSVKEGDFVQTGDILGIIGSTGKSTGVHLHFEIRVNGEKVDPSPYIYEKI